MDGGEAVDVDHALGAAGGQVGPVHGQRRAADTAVVHHLGAAHRGPNKESQVPYCTSNVAKKG